MSAEKNLVHKIRRAKPLTTEEGTNILKRDQFRCQYCGLDGMANFDNSLIMTVDFIIPRARKGKKDALNLVAACRPCNTLKGERTYSNFEEAKEYVLKKREELRQEWEAKTVPLRSKSAPA
jgi:5-methylcytosine-specific restriction endonuclease McrA